MDDAARPALGSDSTLSALIASRLCHDLSNPLGAIGNGVELLDMTDGGDSAERALIGDALRDAQARVRFFRLAFGAAPPDHMTSGREAATTAQDMFAGTRLRLDWAVAGDHPRSAVKLGLLMLLCVDSALPMGGAVRVAMDAAGQWQIQAETDRLMMDADLWSVLRFGDASAGRAIRPAEVQFPALYRAATEMGLTVNYRGADGVLEISLH